MPTMPICRLLEWDSNFFHYRIARFESTNPEDMFPAIAWCQEQQVDCLYLLVNASDHDAMELAHRLHFRLTDMRVTLAHNGAEWTTHQEAACKLGPGMRPVRQSDIPDLAAIARHCHGDSRFFADPHFPRDRCRELYEIWITNSCNGHADHVITFDFDGKPCGYVTCHIGKNGTGEIGLLGVVDSQRGQGFGCLLVKAALKWFASQGVIVVTVATQGRNIPAQRLYQRNGFVTESIGIWYHLWFGNHSSLDMSK